MKCDIQRQLVKLEKDQNYAIDLTSCSHPIEFIKAYIGYEFEDKIAKTKMEDLFEINSMGNNEGTQMHIKKD
jgi:hypothetical protein